MNGQFLTTTLNTKNINALVQCAESVVIPPRSNAQIPCKANKMVCQINFERICRFEPSSRLHSDNSPCHTYDGIVVIDQEVKSSGIFHIVMTNKSQKTIKINKNSGLGLLKSCDQENISTIHTIASSEELKGEDKPQKVERLCGPVSFFNVRDRTRSSSFTGFQSLPSFNLLFKCFVNSLHSLQDCYFCF